MYEEYTEFEAAIRVTSRISGLDVRAYNDPNSMASLVSAELDSKVTTLVADTTIKRLGAIAGMGGSEFLRFLRFLAEDPELRDRFTAYKTAKRLMGE